VIVVWSMRWHCVQSGARVRRTTGFCQPDPACRPWRDNESERRRACNPGTRATLRPSGPCRSRATGPDGVRPARPWQGEGHVLDFSVRPPRAATIDNSEE